MKRLGVILDGTGDIGRAVDRRNRAKSRANVPAPAPDKLEAITAFFNNEVATGKLPGAVILVQQHGRPLYLKSFGVQDVETGTPMSPDTIFAIHSMTKPITSLAAMMLIDDGKLALNDPLSKYIPSFAKTEGGNGRSRSRTAPTRSSWRRRSIPSRSWT